uniref:N-acetylglucosaminylphosphatidylinositol deacetylase n=1 Tax=Nicotiana sylvestris TaxID=4096 RepID=A0A1U7UP55_NICSY|nr:PREDICTED: probable N-acetylglucosaminyl-phosphatidylinositol de-N-acetylase isoform X2 [Nicotiana sylvestris]XP_009757917.1 PREDICTED: probable N-acetylglucosaminyl-phosphatidylinositol de-N-acetylase isoform X2 [Nicotiana sylvestris]
MEWLVIIVTVVVLWVASLFKILHESLSASQVAVLNDGGVFCKRNVLLVIAHPDDESMFFTPTMNYLASRGCNLHILCMSTGNADGMGNVRKEELYLASVMLKVPQKQVKILDHPDLQDGFGKSWNSKLLSKIIKEEIANCDIDLVVTFDNYGVSGHCNHCDVHQGVRKLLQYTSHGEVEAWELVSSSLVSLPLISTNILRKYSGPVDIWLSILSAKFHLRGVVHCLLNEHPRRSLAAMAQHKSQWVWFRKLFVCFSSYTYVNCLKKIN